MTTTVPPSSDMRSRVSRLYQYLHELYQMRNPPRRTLEGYPWSLLWDDLPVHELLAIYDPDKSDISQANESAEELLLRVGRPVPLPCPPPPDELTAWMRGGWEQIDNKAFHLASRPETVLNADGEPVVVNVPFEDDPARVAAWEHWQARRDAWIVEQRPAYKTLEVFDHLYLLHGTLQREGERFEILLCNGMLNWRLPDGNLLNHPLISMRLELKFNAQKPEFTLAAAESPVRFYSALFQSLNALNGRQLADLRAEVEEAQFHPLVPDELVGFLKRAAATLDKRGQFLAHVPQSGSEDYPRLWSSPVVLLANRDAGFAATLDAISEDLRGGAELPDHLRRIVGEETASGESDEAPGSFKR